MKKILFILTLIILSLSTCYAVELRVLTPESYYQENPTPDRQAIINSIIDQFHDQSSVSQSELDLAWKRADDSHDVLRVQIINQKLYTQFKSTSRRVNQRIFGLLNYLLKILKSYVISDVDILIHISDGAMIDFSPAPSLIMSKDRTSKIEAKLILMPDGYMIDQGWQKTIDNIKVGRSQYKWSEKTDKIFWRGAKTGGLYSIENIDKIPRIKLVMLSNQYPDLIDASFVIAPPLHEPTEGVLALQRVMDELKLDKAEPISEAKHLQYKYLISIDGNTCAWKRVPWIMYSNSVLIKQETTKEQWFYKAIKPYVHYVPVDENLDNLLAQLDWMQHHQAEVRKISDTAHNFIADNMMPNDIAAHMGLIINQYHKLHTHPIKATLPPAEEQIKLLKANIIGKKSWTRRLREACKDWFIQLTE
jgi:hypothetical protein